MRENLTKEEAGIHTQTYYRWRKEYGGLKLDQAKRLKELEKVHNEIERIWARLDQPVKYGFTNSKVFSNDCFAGGSSGG